MSDPERSSHLHLPIPGGSGNIGVLGFRTYSWIIVILAAAALSLFAAIPTQSLTLTELAIIIIALGGWLCYSLFFGFGFRATMMFSALYFVKPLPAILYCILLMFAFSYFVSFYHTRKTQLRLPYPFAIMILMAACVQGLVRARNLGDAAIYFFATVIVPLTCLIYINNSRVEKGDFELWLRAITIVAAFLGIVGVILGILYPSKRIGSLWVTAMTINGFYTMCFFFGLGLAMKATDKKEKILWYLAVLLIFMGMMYTYTRIALVAVVFGLALMMWRIKRFRWVGIFMLLLVPLAIPGAMMTRIQASFVLDYSIFVRLLAWYNASLQILAHPLFGIGIETWKEWYVAITPFNYLYAQHPHNVYIKILLEIGIFGFLAYFSMIWIILKNYYKTCIRGRNDSFDFMILLGMVALLFACLTDIFIQQYSISLVFWIALAFIYQRTKEESCKNLIN